MSATTYYIESNWNDMEKDTSSVNGDSLHYGGWALEETDKLCFKCPLADCKESSSKCLIVMSKNIGLDAVKKMLGIK